MDKPISPARGTPRHSWLLSVLALAAILALAAGLRFYRIDVQSLWNDEGTSIALAGRSLRLITEGAAGDIHPPLYHYLLHYWLALLGSSEAAARSLSAIAGVALVAVTFLAGRRLFGLRTGLAAGLASATYAYQVYYAQEARMYMLLTLLCALSSYLFYLGWLAPGARRRGWPMVGWVLVTAMAVYTQYLAAGVVIAQDLAWVVALIRSARREGERKPGVLRQALTWLGAQALVAALYLPWLLLTWDQLHRWPAVSEPFGLLALLERALPLFALGPTVEQGTLGALVVAVLGLAAMGLFWPDRRGEESASGRLLALLHWLGPLALLYCLSRSRPVYHPKFLLLATPGLMLLVGRGIARLAPGRWPAGRSWLPWLRAGLASVATLAMVAASVPGLDNYYFDPRYARDDYRGAAQYIDAIGEPGDVILINAPSQVETFAYYYHGPLATVPIPLERPPKRKPTESRLAEVTQNARRVFGIFWATDESDPQRIVEGWLDGHAYKALDAWYGRLRLLVYAMPSQEMGDRIQHPLAINLGGQVRLDGYTLASPEVEAGGILQLNLFWEATNVIQRRYKVFTHVVDEAGHLVGQRDAEPGGGAYLTTLWQEGEQVLDRYGLPILPGTPPGEYLIEVGMYNPNDGLRLPVVEGGQVREDHIVLQKVRVVRPQTPPPLAALDMQRQLQIKGEDLQLLGFSFGPLGSAYEGATSYRPGQPVELVLFWQALRVPQGDVQATISLVGRAGQACFEQRLPLAAGRYPPPAWQAGEVVRDSVHLRLPPDLAPGRYRLLLSWEGLAPAETVASRTLYAFVVE